LVAEGPIWYQNKLFYVEYGRGTVTTWDGKRNEVFWKQDGCNPSAVLPTDKGEFVVTCYDNNTIGRISADGKTLPPYDNYSDGHAFIGPNDFAPDKDGGIYFTGSGKSGPLIDGSADYIGKDGSVTKEASDLHNANGLVMSNDGKILIWSRPRTAASSSSMSRVLDAPGTIIVVDNDAKLLRTLSVPSPSMRNFPFGQEERCLTSWRWTRSTQPPGAARSMRFRTPSDPLLGSGAKPTCSAGSGKESMGGAIRAV
jgi:gluconolactonase